MMKKIIYLSLIVLCLTGCKKKSIDNIETVVDEKLSETSGEQETVTKSDMNIKDLIAESIQEQESQNVNNKSISSYIKENGFLQFEPLAKNDFFEIEFDDSLYAFLIYKISNNQKILYYNINHGWHDIYLSNDKKKIWYALYSNIDYKLHNYLLDGNTGQLRLITDLYNESCPSKDFKYLVVSSWYEHWPSLIVIYMDTLDVKYNVPWDVSIRNAIIGDGGECQPIMYNKESMEDLSKSLKKHNLEIIIDEGEFDCIVYLLEEEGGDYYGYGYFNAESGKLVTHMVDLYNEEYY
ncbi:MAG: hypothetical protein IKX23_04900 [Treponema sp.]|nr:hypothetical protein [Treponema sp.]